MLFISVIIKNSYAQNIHKALTIGDQVPDIRFEVMKSTPGTPSLSGLKGKLVILYLWDTTCSSCIQKFPHLDSLQEIFGDRIKIVLVDPRKSKDEEQRVDRIFNIYKKRFSKPIGLSSAINDTLAVRLFPYRFNGHFVWIDQNGIFKNTSGSITQKNIELILAGKDPGIITKDDFFVNNQNENLFSKKISNIRFKSMITGFLDGLSHDFEAKYGADLNSNKLSGFRYLNRSLLDILSEIHERYLSNTNRIVFEGLNRSDFIHNANEPGDVWVAKNYYCYEMIAPGLTKEDIKQQAKNDIEKSLGIRCSIETRMVLSWIIKMDQLQMHRIKRKNAGVDDLMTLENIAGTYGAFQRLDIPVIVETNYDDKIFKSPDAEFAIEDVGLSDLQRFVKDNGLTMVKEERMIEVFVIKKAK